jgi:hypothetical protein
MPHHVYANDNEICSKSADGTSVMAPDVCFTPGAPMPGVPILYMNMCKAPDIANGSKTVFIKREEICLEDKSYFATSYGDEPATQAMAKGTVSGAVQGKCYFISWSPNVFAEGLAVTRHLDLVTHNHSNPPNTPPVPYLSSANVNSKCKDDLEKIAKACAPDDEQKKLSKKRKKTPFASLLGRRHNQAMDRKSKGGANWPGAWMEDHCDGLWIKPQKLSADSIEKLKSEVASITPQSLLQHAKDQILNLDNLTGFLADKGLQVAINQGEKWVIRAAATHGTATVVGAVGAVGGPTVVATEGIAHTVGVVVDVASAVWSIGSAGVEIYNELDILGKIEDLVSDKIAALGKYKEQLAKGEYTALMADAMELMATLNACTRARRCMLVQYNDTKGADGLLDGKGCCPGQSGHHLLPEEMMEGRAAGTCSKYSHGTAPTICVEGTNNKHGSHGKIHANLRDRINNYKKGALFGLGPKRDTISVDDAIELGARSVQNTFPESRCDKKCLIAQLEEYYKNRAKCNGSDQLKAAAGVDGVVDPPANPADGAEE